MGIIVAFFALALYAVIIFFALGGMWKTFTKAGQPGWACLVPIYNYLVMADVAQVNRSQVWKAMAVGFAGYILYMMMFILNQGDSEMILIAFVILMVTIIGSLYFMFPVFKGIARNFGQSEGFAWGLLFLNVIFFAILGFGSAQYLGQNNINNPDILDSDLNI